MSEVNVLTIYEEYIDILALLKGKPYEILEDTNMIVISLSDKLSLDLFEAIGKRINHFTYSLNPLGDPFEDVIEDLKRGSTHIEEIDSITLDIQKEISFKKVENLDLIFFEQNSVIESLKNFSHSNRENKLNIGVVNTIDFETQLLNFVNVNNEIAEKVIHLKKLDPEITDHLDFYLSNNKKSNQTMIYNPYSFVIKDNNQMKEVVPLINMIRNEFYYTMLDCLSDKLEGDFYVIRGEKNINMSKEKGFTTKNYQTLVHVFLFLISQKKYTEKYIIIKKVISLYMNDKDNITVFDNKLENIWKTINHYYNHYIEDNIKDFFKTKDQLLKEAMSASKVIYEQTDKVSNSIVASILSVLIIIVTTIFRSLTNISLSFVLIFLLVLFVFSFVFYVITKNSSEKRFELTRDQFNHFINEISLIPEREVEEIKKIYLLNPYKELTNSIRRLFWSLLIFNLLFLVVFVIYIFIKYKLINYVFIKNDFISILISIFRNFI
ncbi:hypothetical protein [Metabacillus halosaccharovorans]|uniref:hypothetical protein n=1 Tax=Metabacillus halosaccharovorans TaxID=930124 RepID=UPI00099552B5|nr:hypothetical protein [Metabacillus halosaccharovorans]